jgi:LysR family transcriptional activator of nhaA
MDAINRLNFHHLRYFWTVAREGGLAAAGRKLRLSHSTLSAQIQSLEDELGAPLFTRVGRRLVLTTEGQTAFRYADEIFSRGRDLLDAMAGEHVERGARLHVGVVDVVPKMIVRKLIEPVLALDPPVRLVVREASLDRLLADLAIDELDVVISDSPPAPGSLIRAHAHELGQSTVTLLASARLAASLRDGYPQSLDGAPMLLPTDGSPLRRGLEQAFAKLRVRPRIVAEFEDSALLKVMGASGAGVFAAPTVVVDEVVEQYRVRPIGALSVHERFFAITARRRIANLAVETLAENARDLFAGSGARAARPRRRP